MLVCAWGKWPRETSGSPAPGRTIVGGVAHTSNDALFGLAGSVF